jgi:uncharacterized protein (TIGR02145 family)
MKNLRIVAFAVFMVLCFLESCKEDQPLQPNKLLLHSNVKVIESDSYELVSSEAELENGTYIFNILKGSKRFRSGDILLSQEEKGFLRKVLSCEKQDGKLVFETVQATMEETFAQGEIRSKSILPVSEPFVDDRIYINLAPSTISQHPGLVLETQGDIYIDPDFVFDMNFGESGLESFESYVHRMGLSSKLDVSLDATQSLNLSNQMDSLTSFQNVYQIELEGLSIPVVLDIDIFIKYSIESNTAFQEHFRYQTTNDINLGLEYEGSYWSSYQRLELNEPTLDSIYTTASNSVQMEIIPRIKISFFNVAGPYFEPSLKVELDAFVSSSSDWHVEAKLKNRANIGGYPEILGVDVEDYDERQADVEVYYTSPYTTKRIEGELQAAAANQTLAIPIKAQLLDLFGNPQSNVQAYLNVGPASGSVDNQIVLSDAGGFVTANWTLGSAKIQRLDLDLKKANGESIGAETFTAINTTECNLSPVFGTFTDPRDGNIYETVVICGRKWLAENLRYNSPGSLYNPANPTPKNGRLYDWNTALTACPTGWRLPTRAEWDTLEISQGIGVEEVLLSGARGDHAKSLRATSWSQGTNSSGFNILPAGEYSYNDYRNLGNAAVFWSSTTDAYDSNFIQTFGFRYFPGVTRSTRNLNHNFLSCRCIED